MKDKDFLKIVNQNFSFNSHILLNSNSIPSSHPMVVLGHMREKSFLLKFGKYWIKYSLVINITKFHFRNFSTLICILRRKYMVFSTLFDPDCSISTSPKPRVSVQDMPWLTPTHHRYSRYSSEISTLSTLKWIEIVCDILCRRFGHEHKYANRIRNTNSCFRARYLPRGKRVVKYSPVACWPTTTLLLKRGFLRDRKGEKKTAASSLALAERWLSAVQNGSPTSFCCFAIQISVLFCRSLFVLTLNVKHL